MMDHEVQDSNLKKVAEVLTASSEIYKMDVFGIKYNKYLLVKYHEMALSEWRKHLTRDLFYNIEIKTWYPQHL